MYPSVEHNPDGMSIKFSKFLSIDILDTVLMLGRMVKAETGIAAMTFDVYHEGIARQNLKTLIRVNRHPAGQPTLSIAQTHYIGDLHWRMNPETGRMCEVQADGAMRQR